MVSAQIPPGTHPFHAQTRRALTPLTDLVLCTVLAVALTGLLLLAP